MTSTTGSSPNAFRYADAVDDRYAGVIDDALAFYRTVFDASGAPDWDEESVSSRDVHARAQGVLTFSYAGDDGFARRILNRTLGEPYGGLAGSAAANTATTRSASP